MGGVTTGKTQRSLQKCKKTLHSRILLDNYWHWFMVPRPMNTKKIIFSWHFVSGGVIVIYNFNIYIKLSFHINSLSLFMWSFLFGVGGGGWNSVPYIASGHQIKKISLASAANWKSITQFSCSQINRITIAIERTPWNEIFVVGLN
jgi:hypothetical protein